VQSKKSKGRVTPLKCSTGFLALAAHKFCRFIAKSASENIGGAYDLRF
jgi:hypothetical protein